MPENKLDDEKVLRMFVDRLIADKGGDTLDVKQKGILQKELLEELDERIQQAMIRALPDAKLMELEKLLDEDAPDEIIEGLFKGAGMDFDPAIRKAMDEFRTDYFKDKIKVSVKTSILEVAPAAAVETPKVEAAQVGSATSMVPVAPAGPAVSAVAPVASAGSVAPAVGQPVQGAVSAVPGQSNVEGVANAVSAAEQGQAPAVQTQVVAQGANTTPAQPAASAIEQPLQAAPNLMDALNAATAGLNTTVNMNSAAESSNAAATNANVAATNANVATVSMNAPVASANVDASTGVNANTNNGANAIANTDMTGKEA